MIQTIIIFLLFYLPLLVFPFGVSPFESPKIILALLGIEFLAITSLAINKLSSLKRLSKISLISLLAIFVLSVIHLFFFRTSTVFFGDIFRLSGVFLLWHLLILALISSNYSWSKNIKIVFIPFLLILISGFLFGPNKAGRIYGTLGEPNALAATFILFWPILFLFIKNNKSILIQKIGILFLAIVAILFSRSVSGLIALSLQLLFLFLTRSFKISFGKSVVICFLITVLCLVLPFFAPRQQFEDRTKIWQTSLLAGLKSPIVGTGFGNIAHSLDITSKTQQNILNFAYVDSTHNLFLDFWVQSGIIGLLALGGLLFHSIIVFIKEKKELEIILFLGLFVCAMFNPLNITSLIAFWWVLGKGLEKSPN